jgi:hypothetical protein
MNKEDTICFDTRPLLDEINTVIQNGITNLTGNFIHNYRLYEETHKYIMKLPSIQTQIQNEINKKYSTEINEINELRNEINNLKKYSILPFEHDDKLIESHENDDTFTGINKDGFLFQVNKNKEEDAEEAQFEDADEDQVEDEEEAEDEDQFEDADQVEEKENITLHIEEKENITLHIEETEIKEDVTKYLNDCEVEEEEETDLEEESELEDELEEESELEDEKADLEEANSVESENDSSKEEEEEEYFEIEIDDITYYTNCEENGIIYNLDADGNIGNKIGFLKDGTAVFY